MTANLTRLGAARGLVAGQDRHRLPIPGLYDLGAIRDSGCVRRSR
jgi:hypothetical protein